MRKNITDKTLYQIRKRMHGIAYLFAAGMLILCCCCSGDPTPELPTSEPSIPEDLRGTMWKLAGIVDVKTGVLTELEPKDCERCYTLEFDMDSTISLHSTTNEGRMSINDITDDHIPNFSIWTEVAEVFDGVLYTQVHLYITSYTQEGNELKFFYQIDGKESYLRYKFIAQ
jgi:hypothetical protein